MTKILKALCIFVFLFVVYAPLISKINFKQNDDWYYYLQVNEFLSGNFKLYHEISSTFYVQGIMGLLFTIFTKSTIYLPYLTLLIGVLNAFILFTILKNLSKRYILSTLGSLLFFFNPLYQYCLVGFMTEVYFIFFFLLSVHFFQQSKLHLFNFFSSVCILTKQIGLIIPLCASIYFLFIKSYKKSFLQFCIFILYSLLYLLLFPKTSEMALKPLIFTHLTKANYSYSVIYGSLIYVFSFLLPLFVYQIYIYVLHLKPKKLIMHFFISLGLFIVLNKIYVPSSVSWGEYPYFENTFERTGFLPREIHGTKYQFRGNYDLFKYLDLISKIALCMYIPIFVTKIKKIEFELLFTFLYLSFMILAFTFYDRYIVILIPVVIIYLFKSCTFNVDKMLFKAGITFYILFLSFLSYQFINDFILTRNFIWSSSKNLNAQRNSIYANTAWNEEYKSDLNSYKYLFSYDSPDKLKGDHVLIKFYEPSYFLNIFVNPKIYLYQRVTTLPLQ